MLFVADGRSPIALNWIDYFLEAGEEVHLVSTFDCKPDRRLASFIFLPVAFSRLKRSPAGGVQKRSSPLRSPVRLRTAIRQWFGPLTIFSAAASLQKRISDLQPELVHALRIPYEGMVAARAVRESSIPLLISVWGNDFTLHAPSSPLMGWFTRRTLDRADALHADCVRDVRLAERWGFDMQKRSIVLPGAGGIQADLFYPPKIPVSEPVVIQPRGFRAYVNNAAFFQAVPLVLRKQPKARFICPAMANEPQAQMWLNEQGIAASVELLPVLTRPQMADHFRQARVAVSPSNHDGTPNTLLEAMACGCIPVAGDLESIREWIRPEQNGLLVDPNNSRELAQAIISALEDDQLQQRAVAVNLPLIAEKAEYQQVMRRAVGFYREILRGS